MAKTMVCPKCGAPLTHRALDGLCPACVLGMALEAPAPATALTGGSAPAPAPAAPSPSPVRFFGRYELLTELARGGMGVIYKARQIGLDRVVAVKMVLGGHFASHESIQRFGSEARAAAKLQHPNIVALHEVGEHEGQPFFSMDYVEGRSLAELVREQPLPAVRAARYVQIIAEAIQYAHTRGVLHRDLKPSNVLIDEQDQPRITDFGLAKRVEGETELKAESQLPGTERVTQLSTQDPLNALTLTGQMLGSPNYMPPEQVAVRRGNIGPWSDVYSIGAILYHLITGRGPFLADTLEQTLNQVLNNEPVPPRALIPALPRDLETICLKCLEKDPPRRYPTAQELAEELRRFLDGQPIRARPVGFLVKTWRLGQRYPATAGLLAAVVLLLVALGFGSTAAALRIKQAEKLATEKLRQSYLEQARARRGSGQIGQRFESLAALSNATALNPPADLRFQLRNEVIAALSLVDARFIHPRPIHPTPDLNFISFAAQFDLYARLDERLGISIRRTADESEVASLKLTAPQLWFFHGFSPNGRMLAIEYNAGVVQIWDLAEQRVRFQTASGEGYPSFSPDNRTLATHRANGTVAVYDLERSEILNLFEQASVQSSYARFDPAGRRLAWFNSAQRIIEIQDLESGARLGSPPYAARVIDLNWRHDGRMLAAACEDGRGVVWDTQNLERRFTLEGHDRPMLRLAFSQNGQWIATSSWDDTIRFWDGATGRPLLRLPGMSYQLTFSSDDRRLAFVRQDEEFGLIEFTTPTVLSTLAPREQSPGPFQPAFSRDGRVLANACKQGVQLWNVASGQLIGLIREPACRSVQFAPDGSSLITSGLGGLGRWEIEFNPAGDGAAKIGAREPLPFSGAFMQLAASADGETLAAASREKHRVLVFKRSQVSPPTWLRPHSNVQFVALSADGRWAASAPWGGNEILMWNAQSGELLRQLPSSANATVEFSPNGQWLVTAGEEYRLWKTGSWDASTVVPLPRKVVPVGYAAFSPDSRMLAVVHVGREIYLFDVGTVQLLAVLQTPPQALLAAPQFSPDGDQLAAAGPSGEVFLWNLRLIREQLAALKLDW